MRMNLKIFIVTEGSPMQKVTYCVTPFIENIQNSESIETET